MPGNGYYTSHAPRFRRLHRTMLSLYRADVSERFGEPCWAEIALGANVRFEALLGEIPYIGGSANPFSHTLVQTASLLALWRELKSRGLSGTEFGAMTNRAVPALLNRYPRFLLKWAGKVYLSRPGRRRVERLARHSQTRTYPGDFVYEVVGGSGSTAWGIDYQECGIVKFLRSQGAEELSPYLCALDHAAFAAMGIGLQRTGTIAQGNASCDFRFVVLK